MTEKNPEMAIENDGPERKTGSERTSRKSKSQRIMRVGKPLGIAVVLAAGVLAPTNYARVSKLDDYNRQEKLLVSVQGKEGFNCLNRALILKAGVVYRDTPQSIDSQFPFSIKDNKAGEVADGEETMVKRPIWYIDASNNTWAGFNLNNEETKELVWVNYSKLASDGNNLVEVLDLDNGSNTLTTECKLEGNGQFTVANDLPAAFTVGSFDAGIRQRIDYGLDAKR